MNDCSSGDARRPEVWRRRSNYDLADATRSLSRREPVTGPPCWVVLTQGTRPELLAAAVESIRSCEPTADVVVVQNGGPAPGESTGARIVDAGGNLGVPGGRDLGFSVTVAPIVCFLDDDAMLLTSGAHAAIVEAFDREPSLGAISFRIVDERGETSRRHIPRIGEGSAERPGPVVNFLGGACAIRRSAYDEAGGYWSDLFYAHEELDLSWRLHDSGFGVRYEPSIEVQHPKTEISRHDEGWRLTGRNRVMIARRNLPWTIAVAHVGIWLVAGLVRTPNRACRIAYARGWRSGWSASVERRPIRWVTVATLARRGRPPIV